LLPFSPEPLVFLSTLQERKDYKTTNLLVFCYGCKTLSLTLTEVQRPSVFKNMVLKRIFGPKRYEVTGEWRKLHNDEIHNLNSSPRIIRMIK
jgi:hypothetical protein